MRPSNPPLSPELAAIPRPQGGEVTLIYSIESEVSASGLDWALVCCPDGPPADVDSDADMVEMAAGIH